MESAGQRPGSPGIAPEELRWLGRLTDLLDSKFRIPGTQIRFGLDPVIGLVPYFGEIVSFSISGILILSMVRHGASGRVVSLMLVNLVVDTVTGFVPGFGDLFDVWFKSNRRNYNLLLQHQAEGKHHGSAWPVVVGVGVVILVLFVAMIWGMVAMVQWVASL